MKNKRIINFGAIGLSLIFLFNPNINIIDFLPDFIGYILLCVALTSLADMNDTVAEAHAAFKKMILIDAAKLLALLWVFGISVAGERNSSLMLWSFTFGVLEMVFAIPAFLKLFKGLSELGYLHDNTSVVGSRKANKKSNYTDKLRRLTVFFISLKAILSFLPEMADLTSTEYYENAGLVNLYRYIGIMRFLAFIPVLVVGVAWIIRAIMYFKRIEKDTAFVNALEEVYRERVSEKKGIFVKRNVAISFFILLIAVFFSFDFRLQGFDIAVQRVNMLPDFVTGALLIAFFAVAARRTKIKKGIPTVICVSYILLSLWAYISEFTFFKNFNYSAVDRSLDARNSFYLMSASAVISTVMFCVLCFFVLFAVQKIIREHTGAISVSSQGAEAQQKMSEAIRAELNIYIYLCGAAVAFYAVTDILYVFLAKDYGFMFLINVIGALICFASFIKLYFEVYEAVSARYILE